MSNSISDTSSLRKLFIGGLSYGTDDEKLKKYFSVYGPVQDAVVMKDPISRRSRGFGFITFCDIESVDNALAHEPHTIDARRVEAKRAVPRVDISNNITTSPGGSVIHGNSIPSSLSSSPSNSMTAPIHKQIHKINPSNSINKIIKSPINDNIKGQYNTTILSDEYAYNKIFVGGLHYDTRDAEFRSYFEKYGKVISAEVMFNRETHKSRGFGFIIFEQEQSAIDVCLVPEHIIDGKLVEVKRAVPRSKISNNSSVNSPLGSSPLPDNPPTSNITTNVNNNNFNPNRPIVSVANPVSFKLQSTNTISPRTASQIVQSDASPIIKRVTSNTSYAAALRLGNGLDDVVLGESSDLDQYNVNNQFDINYQLNNSRILSDNNNLGPLPGSLQYEILQQSGDADVLGSVTSRSTSRSNSIRSLSFDQTNIFSNFSVQENNNTSLLPPQNSIVKNQQQQVRSVWGGNTQQQLGFAPSQQSKQQSYDQYSNDTNNYPQYNNQWSNTFSNNNQYNNMDQSQYIQYMQQQQRATGSGMPMQSMNNNSYSPLQFDPYRNGPNPNNSNAPQLSKPVGNVNIRSDDIFSYNDLRLDAAEFDPRNYNAWEKNNPTNRRDGSK